MGGSSLALSLHSAVAEVREELIPLARRHSLDELRHQVRQLGKCDALGWPPPSALAALAKTAPGSGESGGNLRQELSRYSMIARAASGTSGTGGVGFRMMSASP